jgi:hypothetical protein
MSSHEVIKHSRRIFGIFKNNNLKFRHKIGEIIIEILIIVFAILLSLFLERWRQNQEDHHLEKKFLQGLKVDLTKDFDELKSASSKWISMRDAAKYFLKPAQMLLRDDSSNFYAYKLFHNVYFFPNTNRYEALKTTGKLDVIGNEQLQNDIIDLYQTKIPDLQQQINFFNDFLNTQVKNYLIQNLKRDSTNSTVIDKSFFSNAELKNILSFYSDLDDVLKRSNATVNSSEMILKEIEKSLE